MAAGPVIGDGQFVLLVAVQVERRRYEASVIATHEQFALTRRLLEVEQIADRVGVENPAVDDRVAKEIETVDLQAIDVDEPGIRSVDCDSLRSERDELVGIHAGLEQQFLLESGGLAEFERGGNADKDTSDHLELPF